MIRCAYSFTASFLAYSASSLAFNAFSLANLAVSLISLSYSYKVLVCSDFNSFLSNENTVLPSSTLRTFSCSANILANVFRGIASEYPRRADIVNS